MDDQFERDMQDVKNKVSEMYYALMGNPLSKDGGLIGRIDRMEKKIENHDGRLDKQDEKQSIMSVYQKIIWLIGGGIASAIIGYIFNHI